MLATGATVGPYKILAPLGAGGMGEVYRAHDIRLGRDVAIKALPEGFAHDPERLARFEREAKVLASLSHPNIAAIHGLEEVGGNRYLVLEYIEGPTLADRIAQEPLRLAEVLEVCRDIAGALEAAHERGIVHRDLKPGNVMLPLAGAVKVLDFGLARGEAASGSDPSLAESPTLTTPPTGAGVILGTAAYLSPEQARGKTVDRRTDIWSFGCVLSECLTGKQTFEGETVSDLIAKILEREPDWTALPANLPVRVRELLKHCLEKDAKKRLRDIGDARIELEEALSEIQSGSRLAVAAAAEKKRTPPATTRFIVQAVGAGLLAGGLLGVVFWNTLGPGASLERKVRAFSLATRLSVALPREIRFRTARLSPDGSALICLGQPRKSIGSTDQAEPMLYVRRLNSFDAKPLAGTEGALGFVASRDSRYVFFVVPASKGSAKLRLLKAPLDGNTPPIPLTDWKDNWGGGVLSLHSGDLFVMFDQGASYLRVPSGGGEPTAPIKTDAGAFRGSLTPTDVLPGDKGILLNGISYGSRGWYYQIGVMNPKTGKVRFLLDDGGNAVYSPTGHLLFARGDVLLAAPFDLGRQATTGPPVAILRGLLTFYTVQPGSFTLAGNGTLAHRPGGAVLAERQLVFMDANGVVKAWSEERRPYAGDPVISRDGQRFAIIISNAQGIDECWVSEVNRPALRRVVAIPDADCDVGAMAPDGQWLAYRRHGRDARDGIYLQRTDGRGEPKLVLRDPDPSQQPFPVGWAPDGSVLLIIANVDGRAHMRVLRSPLASEPAAEPKPLISGFVDDYDGAFSPDGRLLAFTSNESGKSEVYVCAYYPDGSTSDPVRVSAGGGRSPHWTPGGKSLLYVADPGRLMSVALATVPAITASAPVQTADLELVQVTGGLSVLPDGRMLGIQTSDLERGEVTSVNVVLNLFEELKKKSRKGE